MKHFIFLNKNANAAHLSIILLYSFVITAIYLFHIRKIYQSNTYLYFLSIKYYILAELKYKFDSLNWLIIKSLCTRYSFTIYAKYYDLYREFWSLKISLPLFFLTNHIIIAAYLSVYIFLNHNFEKILLKIYNLSIQRAVLVINIYRYKFLFWILN